MTRTLLRLARLGAGAFTLWLAYQLGSIDGWEGGYAAAVARGEVTP